MSLTVKLSAAFLAISMPLISAADSWKDESGHGKGRGHGHARHEFKQEYRDGNCKVERKLERSGEYKEERKCRGPHHGHYGQGPVHAPAPHPAVVQPGVTIYGSVHIPR